MNMGTQRKTVEVVAAVLKHNNLVLACRRGHGEFKDWWEFPGGTLEQSALQRTVMTIILILSL